MQLLGGDACRSTMQILPDWVATRRSNYLRIQVWYATFQVQQFKSHGTTNKLILTRRRWSCHRGEVCRELDYSGSGSPSHNSFEERANHTRTLDILWRKGRGYTQSSSTFDAVLQKKMRLHVQACEVYIGCRASKHEKIVIAVQRYRTKVLRM